MTPFELMEAMGNVRDKYVLEAHSGAAEARKRHPSRRFLLVAAIVSLMLLLLGCVAVLLGLKELKLAREPVGPYGEFSSDVISLQGYAGTPNYQAAKEWEDFLQSYDQDGKLLAEATQGSCSFDPAGISMEYAAYTCYTEEMMAKIDEICEKYGLEILGPTYFTEDDSVEGYRETLRELGISSLLRDGAEAELELYGLYYYREGSFQLEGDIRLTAPGNPWPYVTSFQYRSVMKTTFDGVSLTVGNIEDYTQWNYTLPDGTKVLLAQSYDRSLIIVDRDTHFVTVNIPMILIEKPDKTDMDRKALEAIADAFTFDYTPHRPDPDTLVLSDRYLPVTEDPPEDTTETDEDRKEPFTVSLEGSAVADAEFCPVEITFQAEEILSGEEAYNTLREENPDMDPPDSGQEYFMARLQITYDSGELDELSFGKNTASQGEYALFFQKSGWEDRSETFRDSVYSVILRKGETASAVVVFLGEKENPKPLTFTGFGKTVTLWEP